MSTYAQKLQAVCDEQKRLGDSSGGMTLKNIIMDLEGKGPIGGMLFSLDQENFAMVIDLLQEFRRTGRQTAFNNLHAAARKQVKG